MRVERNQERRCAPCRGVGFGVLLTIDFKCTILMASSVKGYVCKRLAVLQDVRHLCNSFTHTQTFAHRAGRTFATCRWMQNIRPANQITHTYISCNCAFGHMRKSISRRVLSTTNQTAIPRPGDPTTHAHTHTKRATCRCCRCATNRLGDISVARARRLALHTMRDVVCVRACVRARARSCMFNKIIKEFVFCSKLHTHTRNHSSLAKRCKNPMNNAHKQRRGPNQQ